MTGEFHFNSFKKYELSYTITKLRLIALRLSDPLRYSTRTLSDLAL